MIKREKRGLSPIIATVLLISITVVLAGIIFFWAYSFVGESVSKDGQAIDTVCKDVAFQADASDGFLLVTNTGNVPLWDVQVRKKNALGGDVINIDDSSETIIKSGESAEIPLNGLSGDIVVSPVLMGETDTERKAYVCGEDYS
mgnify:FL=1